MPTLPLRCGRCQAGLRGAVFNLPGFTPCPGCGASLQTRVFPAYFAGEAVGQAAPAVASPEDASCFFHPRKKAAAACDRCGRFLCALCEVEIEGQRRCPACLSGTARGGGRTLENETVRHDRVAFMVGFWPLFLAFTLWIVWPVYLISAGVTFYLVARYWNEPARAFIPRPRTSLILAALFGALQLVLAALLGWYASGFYSSMFH